MPLDSDHISQFFNEDSGTCEDDCALVNAKERSGKEDEAIGSCGKHLSPAKEIEVTKVDGKP